jgi:tetratricopeptide (TPR) repeat protein
MRLQNTFFIGTLMVLLSTWVVTAQAGKEQAGDIPQKLGIVHFPVSCTPEAQTEFNRAVALLHSFWFAPAIKSFTTVTELDPTCAMGHWGVAMSVLGNPFAWPPPSKALNEGSAAIEKAKATGAKTPREQAYIEAIAAFYKDAGTVDHRTRALAYEKAMEQLARQYPEDREATIFYALALNATALPTDKTYTNQLKAASMLEKIFVEQPDHPGVAHYLIHSYDYPPLAQRGLDAARRYGSIAPSAPHALHMPSHIFTRLGLWQESIDTNRASTEAAKDELLEAHRQGIGSYNALHAMDYMIYGYLQTAQDREAKQILDEIKTIDKLDVENFPAAYAFAAIPARYALERGRWAEAAVLTLHPRDLAWDRFPQAESVLTFARGLGAARSGDIATARKDLDRLRALRETLLGVRQNYWAEQTEIQRRIVTAWIARAEGKNQEALELMQAAADLEDSTEKHPVTPGPLAPARELLGEMLLELNDPGQALKAFEASHRTEPNRFRGLYHAAQAARLAGEQEKARRYYEQLIALSEKGNGERSELKEAKAFLAQK